MIRLATLEDTPAIVRLATRFLATTAYGRLLVISPEQLELLVPHVLEHGVIYLATRTVRVGAHPMVPGGLKAHPMVPMLDEREEIVGFLAAIEATDAYSGNRYADEIAWFVMPEERNSSYGPRLLGAFERWARDKRLSFVKMVAPAESPDVAGFYQSIGYEALETSFVKRF